jgi:hypothetical protein
VFINKKQQLAAIIPEDARYRVLEDAKICRRGRLQTRLVAAEKLNTTPMIAPARPAIDQLPN